MTQWVTRAIATLCFRAKVEGRDHVPKSGGALICSNHQSYLDPFFLGMAIDRPVCFVARRTLFENGTLRLWLRLFDTISIDRDGMGLGGLRAVLRRTKGSQLVLMFPEGTRTGDGRVSPIQPGFSIVAKRAKVPIVPAAIDGAFDALPRGRSMVRFTRVAVCVGEAIPVELASTMDPDELTAELARRIVACQTRAAALRQGERPGAATLKANTSQSNGHDATTSDATGD